MGTAEPNVVLYALPYQWSEYPIFGIGITYLGDYTTTSGLCNLASPLAVPDPPEICPDLEACCSPYLQNHALYQHCMVDGYVDCCANPVDGVCCESVIMTCPDDFLCSDGYCCEDGQCKLCDNTGVCQGSWSELGDCSVTCGVGERTRTYTITSPGEPGLECPFSNGEEYVMKCYQGDCCVDDDARAIAEAAKYGKVVNGCSWALRASADPCNNPEYSELAREICPVTCGACP